MEGFIIAKLAVEAIRKAGAKDLTREKLVTALESINQDFGGYRIAFSPSNHAGSQFVQLTVIGAGGKDGESLDLPLAIQRVLDGETPQG